MFSNQMLDSTDASFYRRRRSQAEEYPRCIPWRKKLRRQRQEEEEEVDQAAAQAHPPAMEPLGKSFH